MKNWDRQAGQKDEVEMLIRLRRAERDALKPIAYSEGFGSVQSWMRWNILQKIKAAKAEAETVAV